MRLSDEADSRKVISRRSVIGAGALAALGVMSGNALAIGSVGKEDKPQPQTSACVPILANSFTTVYESPDPDSVYAYTPGIVRLDSGRLVVTLDIGGPGAKKQPGVKIADKYWRGKVYISDDKGETWAHKTNFPFCHARPFVAGKALYVLGHDGDLMVMRSTDYGATWGDPAKLTDGQHWHQSACNVHHSKGRVYLVMERLHNGGWSTISPVVMSADVNDDLCRRESWTFSNELVFRDVLSKSDDLGVPFYKIGPTAGDSPGNRRRMGVPGWLETNIVQFVDPNHVWCDPSGHTFHLIMRAHTGTTNLACIAKAVEGKDGSITVSLEHAPSGRRILYIPFPGGQMKFYILYDSQTRLYWLLSSQSTDSMTRPERLPPDRFGLPNNERHRLALHFSKNCVDWCFAGLVAVGDTPRQARHYASMAIDGDDLVVVSRSGDKRARSAHDGNLITCHRVEGFRRLVY